eukprot:gene26009-31408_t
MQIDDMALHESLAQIHCPHCLTIGFRPVRVDSQEMVRDYSYQHPSASSYTQASPLKVGETFEDMKRKMIPYKVHAPVDGATSVIDGVPIEGASVSAAVTGIAIEEDEYEGSGVGELIVPTHSNGYGSQSQALIHYTPRMAEHKDGDAGDDVRNFSDAKSIPLLDTCRDTVEDGPHHRLVDNLHFNVGTPLRLAPANEASSQTPSRAQPDTDLLLADEKDDFNDKLSDTHETFDDTVGESMLFGQLDIHHSNHHAVHHLAEHVVGDVVQHFGLRLATEHSPAWIEGQ